MYERLQKLIAAAGLCSRREAEKWIAEGKVAVNGVLARLGDSADPETDVIAVDGKPLPAASPETVTVLVYKPRGVVTTMKDEKGRADARSLLPPSLGRLYPVGRLDRFSEGLLLMTNDGDLANRLTHPAGEVDKTYRLWVSGWRPEALDLLCRPIVLDGRPIAPPQVRLIWAKDRGGMQNAKCKMQNEASVGANIGGPPEADTSDETVGSDAHIAPVIAAGDDAAAPRRQEASGDASLRRSTAALEITIHEGRNRQIRRMAQAAGLTPTRLKRIAEGPVALGDLKPGEWRFLSADEITALRAEK